MFFVHEAASNGNVFSGVLDALANDGHRPVAFDLPGHGRTGGLDSLGDISAMADYTKSLADQLGLSRPILVGEGMGAAVVLECAAAHPDWPTALVLCGGASATPAPPAAEVDQLRLVTSGRGRRQFDQTGYAPDTGRDVYQRAFAEWMKTDPRATIGDLDALVTWGASDRIARVVAPVTVVVGEHEPDEPGIALTGLVKTGRVVRLPAAGRRGALEQPAALAAIISAAVSAAGNNR